MFNKTHPLSNFRCLKLPVTTHLFSFCVSISIILGSCQFSVPPYQLDPQHPILWLVQISTGSFWLQWTHTASSLPILFFSIHGRSCLLEPPLHYLSKLYSAILLSSCFTGSAKASPNTPRVYYLIGLPVSFTGTGCLIKVLLLICLWRRQPWLANKIVTFWGEDSSLGTLCTLAPGSPLFSHMAADLKLLVNQFSTKYKESSYISSIQLPLMQKSLTYL